jgi:hypothetical protein
MTLPRGSNDDQWSLSLRRQSQIADTDQFRSRRARIRNHSGKIQRRGKPNDGANGGEQWPKLKFTVVIQSFVVACKQLRTEPGCQQNRSLSGKMSIVELERYLLVCPNRALRIAQRSVNRQVSGWVVRKRRGEQAVRLFLRTPSVFACERGLIRFIGECECQ